MRNSNITTHKNQLRIIGGKWRSRKFSFPLTANIRPTPNRIRETLFNWLAPVIHGANCLDLFAGSGALGLEALSHGAASVTFVDNDQEVIMHLKKMITFFHAENAKVIQLEVPTDLLSVEKNFNIVFLDPPFFKNLIHPCCEWLEQKKLLAENAYIYIEAEKELNPLPVPSHWKLLKSKIAGQVGYHLLSI